MLSQIDIVGRSAKAKIMKIWQTISLLGAVQVVLLPPHHLYVR